MNKKGFEAAEKKEYLSSVEENGKFIRFFKEAIDSFAKTIQSLEEKFQTQDVFYNKILDIEKAILVLDRGEVEIKKKV